MSEKHYYSTETDFVEVLDLFCRRVRYRLQISRILLHSVYMKSVDYLFNKNELFN